MMEAVVVEAWVVGGLIGYLLGSIPTGLWITKWRGGGDIRASGSGRTGATNARSARWDCAGRSRCSRSTPSRARLPMLIVMAVWDSPTGEVVGACGGGRWGISIPLYAGFRGGRGAATALGAMLAIMPMGALFAIGAAAADPAGGSASCRWRR